MADIHGNFRKLAIACKNVFEYITELPDCGDLEDVNFQFGPPGHGKLPFGMDKRLICVIYAIITRRLTNCADGWNVPQPGLPMGHSAQKS